MTEKENRHKCECGKAFEFEYLLIRHLKEDVICPKIKKQKAMEKKLKEECMCDYCNKKISNKYNLKRHITICKSNSENNQSLENTILDSEEENQDHESDLESFFSNIDNFKEFLNNKDNNISKNNVQNAYKKIKDILKIIEKNYNINNTNNTNSNERPTLFDNTQFDQSIIESIQIDESTTNNNTTNNNNTNNDNSITNNNTTNNNDNSVTNNNTTNNNNIVNNISIVYPFGYENLSHLSQNDMIKILLSNDLLLKALVSVYSNAKNQNYHKHNDKSDKILLLNDTMALEAKDDNEFVSEIIENTIQAIKRMFFICKNKFSFENQLTIWENIRYVHNTIKNEIKKKTKHMPISCKTLINKIFSLVLQEKKNCKYIIKDNSKDNTKHKINNFEEFKAKIDIDPIYKDNVVNLFEVVYDELKKYKESLNDVSITDEILRQYWSDPEDDIELNNEHNDVSKVKVEDTPRYKYYKKMIKNENKELAKTEHSLGNLNAISKIRSERAEAEVETLSDEFNLSDLQTRLIRNKLITEPISENISKIAKLNFQMAN